MPFHSVCFDAAQSVRLCWEKLNKADESTVGFAILSHDPTIYEDRLRIATALEINNQIPLERRIPVLTTAIHDQASIAAWLQEFRPRSIIGFNSVVYEACRELLPPGFEFINLHVTPKHPLLPGTVEDHAVLSKRVILSLDNMMRIGDNGTPENKTVLNVQHGWHDGP